jgi:AraC-like DNA-binding protein
MPTGPDLWETPELAFRAFEELTGLRLAVHDLEVPLWPYLPPERFKHHSPCCLAVKATHDWACMDFEITRLRKEIVGQPDGRCHRCHAGFLEWVMPVFLHDRLAWILFAGQAQAREELPDVFRDVRRSVIQKKAGPALPMVSAARSEIILEALRQLRSRLVEWQAQVDRAQGTEHKALPATNRAHGIRSFLFDHHAADPSVADLARHLSLSESRTIHLVSETFGCGFTSLLNQMRLKTAASLLRNTSLPVQEVCYASGFRDLSHFHRVFRKHFRQTPLHYRKMGGS